MPRTDHFWYDLRALLANTKLLLLLLVIALVFVFYLSFQFIYLFALFFVGMIAARGVIGRRCPRCDGPLKEEKAEPVKDNAFIMIIHWRCPRDGYTETEETKGDSGLFGVN